MFSALPPKPDIARSRSATKGLSLASSGEVSVPSSFAADRSPLLGKFFRSVMGRGRIIKSDQPSLEESPIGGFELKWLTIFARYVVPIGETIGVEQIFMVGR
jgi:hypothetical protein